MFIRLLKRGLYACGVLVLLLVCAVCFRPRHDPWLPSQADPESEPVTASAQWEGCTLSLTVPQKVYDRSTLDRWDVRTVFAELSGPSQRLPEGDAPFCRFSLRDESGRVYTGDPGPHGAAESVGGGLRQTYALEQLYARFGLLPAGEYTLQADFAFSRSDGAACRERLSVPFRVTDGGDEQ